MDDTQSQIEQNRRALQEAIDSAKKAIEQTLDLIERTRAGRSPGETNLVKESDRLRADHSSSR